MKKILFGFFLLIAALSAKAQGGYTQLIVTNTSTCSFAFQAYGIDQSGSVGFGTGVIGLPTGTLTLTAANLTPSPSGYTWEFVGVQMSTHPTAPGVPDGGAWDDPNSMFQHFGNSGSFYVGGCGWVNVLISPSNGGSGTVGSAISAATVTIW